MRKTGTAVTADNQLLMPKNTSAEVFVYTPKVAKTPANK
jgi:hypothetical protein